MSGSPRKARESLRQAGNLAMGVLIGSAIATPAFAAADIVLDDLQLPVLIGSLVLLVIGLTVKAVQRRKSATTAPPPREQNFSEGIGRYRLQLGRGNAD